MKVFDFGRPALARAEKIGLGSMSYELAELGFL